MGTNPDDDFVDDDEFIEAREKSQEVGFDEELHLNTTGLKLSVTDMRRLKNLTDQVLNDQDPELITLEQPERYDIKNVKSIEGLKLSADSDKLKNISVNIVGEGENILVKVGPCDLSYVGGDQIREALIKNLVEQALVNKGIEKSFEDVSVSACTGVRGRWQQILPCRDRNESGTHMNAYIKTKGEAHLTRWEPRSWNAPQHWYNDTVCAMVVASLTSVFEKKVQTGEMLNSNEATSTILHAKGLTQVFDNLITEPIGEKISHLLDRIKTTFANSPDPEREASMTKQSR